ncbi:MAG: cation:proton antiporter, partial [Chitinophagaceae bacterium]|nr:cation:proton antiporter [Chitinophagaceae bacterium]
MEGISIYVYIIAACLLVVSSYLFNLVSQKTGAPSVLLLLMSGIALREVLLYRNETFHIPSSAVEVFGIIGLIMIVLEAGLDLRMSRKKVKLIRNAFLSALFILAFSSFACAGLLYLTLQEKFLHCLVYAIPLSVVSSAIVIPSISHFAEDKKEFLVYETSFSDIIGIIVFNYIIAGNFMKAGTLAIFFGSVILAILLSVVLSILILFMLTKIKTKVRFFLVFAVLIFLYAGGKMLN